MAMTHDELLAKIDERNLSFSHPDSVFSFNDWPNKALRVIVELHKPFQFEDGIDEYKPVCSHCQFGVVGDIYPCETIQAVEKALG